MRVLTATNQDQGARDGDFTFATEGELVLLEFVCASDRRDPESGCGCGRAFAGMSSHRATTTALVRELDLTPDDVELAVTGYYLAGGSGPEVIGDLEFTDLVSDSTHEVIGFAQWFPVGTVLGRRPDSVFPRTVPTPR